MFKKRVAVASVTVLLVCIAVYLNWSYQKSNSPLEAVSGSVSEVGDSVGDTALVNATVADAATEEALAEYFASARLTRQQARDTALGILDERLQGDVAETAKLEAASLAQTIAQNAIRESNIEGIVLAKGYTNCLAYIGDNGLTVIVTSKTGNITALDSAKITDIAISETGLSGDRIKIVEATPEN